MRAAILSIGDELATGQTLDTNGAWLSARFDELDMTVDEHRTLGDDRAAIAAALGELAGGRDVVVVTGGLGPTADDLTRFALGDLIDPGTELVEDDLALAALMGWYAKRGAMPESNRVQAMRPRSARMIDNPFGTAPGLAAEVDGCLVFLLPGPPREMKPMFDAAVVPRLDGRDRPSTATATVPAVGLGESALAERLGSLMDRGREPRVGTTASGGIVTARIRAIGPSAAADAAAAAAMVRDRWRPFAFASPVEGPDALAAAVGAALVAAGRTLVTAESCTGGLIGGALTAVAGSSVWYRGGWVTYDDAMKRTQLGVPAELIAAHGAVSPEVAMAMAAGALDRGPADEAVAVTGIAGPGGAVAGKPVGTVWIGHATRITAESAASAIGVRARRFEFRGEREAVRRRTVISALAVLRLVLVQDDVAPPQGTGVPLLWEDAGAGLAAVTGAWPRVRDAFDGTGLAGRLVAP